MIQHFRRYCRIRQKIIVINQQVIPQYGIKQGRQLRGTIFPKIAITALDPFQRPLDRKREQKDKLLEAGILHLHLQLKHKLSHNEPDGRLIHLIESFVLLLPAIGPVILHLLELSLLNQRHLVLVVVVGVDHNVGEVLEQELT